MRVHLIKNILANNFEWMKKDFILLIGFILVIKTSISYMDIPGWMQFILIFTLLVKVILFSNHAFAPAKINSTDNFSWKFIQSLPLTKHEILLIVGSSMLMCSVPLIVWGICFMPSVNAKILDGDFDLLKLSVHSLFFIFLIGVASVSSAIHFPRREFQKLNANKVVMRFFRNCLLIFTFLIYSGLVLTFVEANFDINVGQIIVKGLNSIFDFVKSWWGVLGTVSFLIYLYFNALEVWENEKKSYHSNVWIPKKEYSLMGGSIALLFVAYLHVDFRTPSLYLGEAQKLVFQKNYKALESRKDLNKPNKHGMTPMMVAIKEGDLKMVTFLRDKGVGFEGKVVRKGDKFKGYDAVMFAIRNKDVELLKFLAANNVKFNEFNKDLNWYPIHAAAYMCHSAGIDFLLEHGNSVDSLNEAGETPIAVATRENCLSPVVALKEAGGNFNIADKKGKLALDKLPTKKASKELKYFLEKNTRAPASKQ